MYKLARHATLGQLQVFEAIGRLKSFTRAAEELFLTQSTVSTQVKNLTDAGKHLYSACQDVFRDLDNVDMATANLRGLKIGTLSISAITTAKYIICAGLAHCGHGLVFRFQTSAGSNTPSATS